MQTQLTTPNTEKKEDEAEEGPDGGSVEAAAADHDQAPKGAPVFRSSHTTKVGGDEGLGDQAQKGADWGTVSSNNN